MIRASFIVVAIAAIVGPACKNKDGDGAAGKATEGKAVKLDKLGLQIDVPGDVEVSDGMSEGGQMLQGADIGAMEVSPAKKPQTIEEAKSDAGMYTPKNLKTDKLPDGWVISYDNTGGAGANFFATVRRDISGKSYTCTTTTNDASRQTAVIAACKSLRK